MELVAQMLSVISWYLSPLIKWFLRQATRLCELQRVCYGETGGAPRTIAVGEFQLRIANEISPTQLRNPIS